jgi:hypothetical protein
MDRGQLSETGPGREHPGWTARLSLAAFALLGHAFVLVLALTAVASAGGLFLLLRLMSSAGYLLLLKLGLPLLAFAWCSIRALWSTLPAPEGVAVERTDAPRLWAVIAELERDLRTPRSTGCISIGNSTLRSLSIRGLACLVGTATCCFSGCPGY